jgi:hypothetical protein
MASIQIDRTYEHSPDEVCAEALMATVFSDGQGLIPRKIRSTIFRVSPTATPYVRGQGEACFARYKAMPRKIRSTIFRIDAVLAWRN